MERMERFMTRRGPIVVVVVARFVEGLRQPNGVVAGATGMPWRRFLPYNGLGVALWVGVWDDRRLPCRRPHRGDRGVLGRYQWYAVVGLAVTVTGWLLLRRVLHRR